MKSVSDALTELHDKLNLAHLDVRLENICIDSNHERATLIDFDRSRAYNRKTTVLDANTRNCSVMYREPEPSSFGTWTLAQLDWRQLGIMISAIINNRKDTYNTEEPTDEDDFIRKLVRGD